MSDWFEVWVDGQRPPWVLIVQSSADGIVVLDPQEGRRQVFTDSDYDTVFNWLREDEFELVKGRTFSDVDE